MITFNQKKKNSKTFEGEAVRLYNDILPQAAQTFVDKFGKRYDKAEKKGIDVLTCTFKEAVNWLADTRIKKSESSTMFVHRVLSTRFPDDYSQHKNKIDNRLKLEHELIQSQSKSDIVWPGEVGYQNKVRLDGTLNNKMSNVKVDRLGKIKIERKI